MRKAKSEPRDAQVLPGILRESKLSRRDFLKTTAAGAVAVGATASALATTSLLQAGSSTTTTTKAPPPSPALWKSISITLNGTSTDVKAKANWTLNKLLRETLGMTGTKIGCDNSSCGACTVLMDDVPVYSCSRLAVEADGHNITTIEGLPTSAGLHPVQQAFMTYGAAMCGNCTPGMIMTSVALLKANPNPTVDQVKKALSGNICRCGSYIHVIQALTGGQTP